MYIKPIDIARKLNITTSTLRHYESWGIVPAPERKPNGYRLYTEEHLAYFECIRAMYPGFGMEIIREIMPLLRQKKIVEALWIVNKAQANLYKEKQKAKQSLDALELELDGKLPTRHKKEWYRIREAAEEIDVPSTTLRHWEKEGLINPTRDLENGYRKYSPADIRRLLIIRTLRSSVYSLDIVREVLRTFDQHDITQARKFAMDSLVHMDYLIKEQLKGLYYLHKLCEVLE